jgi:DNA-3-methyladenine glycosylase
MTMEISNGMNKQDNPGEVLPLQFYLREDVKTIARELLGKVLMTNFNGMRCGGIIYETEAYEGVTDRASHAYGGRKTERTRIMYLQGGIAYIYICYGMHSLFNVVTNREGIPHAVLIRAIWPTDGTGFMTKRLGREESLMRLGLGPGKLSKVLGIHYTLSGLKLSEGPVWIEDRNIVVTEDQLCSSPRIGVEYAGEDALLPYRYYFDVKKFFSEYP